MNVLTLLVIYRCVFRYSRLKKSFPFNKQDNEETCPPSRLAENISEKHAAPDYPDMVFK